MAQEIISRCGFRCDLCLAFQENVYKVDQRKELSEGWEKYFSIHLDAADIICDGCLTCTHQNPRLIDANCPIRQCVIQRSLENCSQCDHFPCQQLLDRSVTLEQVQSRITAKIPAADYRRFIKPYENLRRLMVLREGNAGFQRMLNKMLAPDEDTMLGFIGKEATQYWNEIVSFIESNYFFDRTTYYGGNGYGWAKQYRHKDKFICSLFPERHAFFMVFTFGKKELLLIEERKDRISQQTLAVIDNTHQYHDGKWVGLRVRDGMNVADILQLIQIKRKPKKNGSL